MLLNMLNAERKNELKAAYIGDVLWRIMLAYFPESRVPSYSQYMRTLYGDEEAKSGEEIVDDLIDRIKNRKEAAQRDSS